MFTMNINLKSVAIFFMIFSFFVLDLEVALNYIIKRAKSSAQNEGFAQGACV